MKKLFKMSNNKLTKSQVYSLIEEQANILKRKLEIRKEVIKLNEELKELNEGCGMSSYGFATDSDVMNKSHNGFVNKFPAIYHIARLEQELEDEPMEFTQKEESKITPEQEILSLRNQVEALKQKIKTLEK
jgi:hypothetical protein